MGMELSRFDYVVLVGCMCLGMIGKVRECWWRRYFDNCLEWLDGKWED